ncbi:hypothetical protein [Saccharibacillus alkalitolerans]|uniref:DUF4829 domain-containing protein n=1 Tax=Saccharibacillus alkalitolerans TaxID=2705290 RepID=A0ABX0F2N1_9BACL|nr:hypothetical protein [Saccharibacillus alkalitolerans]NGZ75166.1 hypothetical protein [Saccharibacillus alkalitolerans]
MKKIVFALGIVLLAVGSLAACRPESDVDSPPEVQSANTEAVPAKSEARIDPGVHVDWDAVDSPLWNPGIETKLKAVLDAVIRKDAKTLNEEVKPDSPGAFDYMLEDEYDFRKVTDVRAERNRVLVQVDHDVLMAGSDSVQNGGYYYYFEQDENGQWQLLAID